MHGSSRKSDDVFTSWRGKHTMGGHSSQAGQSSCTRKAWGMLLVSIFTFAVIFNCTYSSRLFISIQNTLTHRVSFFSFWFSFNSRTISIHIHISVPCIIGVFTFRYHSIHILACMWMWMWVLSGSRNIGSDSASGPRSGSGPHLIFKGRNKVTLGLQLPGFIIRKLIKHDWDQHPWSAMFKVKATFDVQCVTPIFEFWLILRGWSQSQSLVPKLKTFGSKSSLRFKFLFKFRYGLKLQPSCQLVNCNFKCKGKGKCKFRSEINSIWNSVS